MNWSISGGAIFTMTGSRQAESKGIIWADEALFLYHKLDSLTTYLDSLEGQFSVLSGQVREGIAVRRRFQIARYSEVFRVFLMCDN